MTNNPTPPPIEPERFVPIDTAALRVQLDDCRDLAYGDCFDMLDEIDRLRAELAEARKEPERIVAWVWRGAKACRRLARTDTIGVWLTIAHDREDLAIAIEAREYMKGPTDGE